jgi:hypothetical protein
MAVTPCRYQIVVTLLLIVMYCETGRLYTRRFRGTPKYDDLMKGTELPLRETFSLTPTS